MVRERASTRGHREPHGCLKHCSQGVTVAVQPDNVWYAKVTPGDLEEICTRHLEGGRPVERLLMPDIPWE